MAKKQQVEKKPLFIIGPTKNVGKEARRGQIVNAVKSGDFSTTELAQKSAFHPSTIRRDCYELRKKGRISSYHQEYTVLSFPMTGEIMQTANHDRLQELDRNLRSIFGKHPLGTKALDTTLRNFFRELRKRSDLAKYHSRIGDFEERLFAALPKAKKRKDLENFLGFRRLPRERLIWTAS